MSKNLKLDSNWDIIIGRGATRTSGVDFVAQNVKSRLLTLLGEWQQDKSLGLPWFEGLLGKHVREADIQLAVSNIISRTNNVLYVIKVNVEAEYSTRKVNISFVAESTYGQIKDSLTYG